MADRTDLSSAVAAFLSEVDALDRIGSQEVIVYANLAERHGLPPTIIADQTLLRAGLIVWRESRGWTVTDRGRTLIEGLS